MDTFGLTVSVGQHVFPGSSSAGLLLYGALHDRPEPFGSTGELSGDHLVIVVKNEDIDVFYPNIHPVLRFPVNKSPFS